MFKGVGRKRGWPVLTNEFGAVTYADNIGVFPDIEPCQQTKNQTQNREHRKLPRAMVSESKENSCFGTHECVRRKQRPFESVPPQSWLCLSRSPRHHSIIILITRSRHTRLAGTKGFTPPTALGHLRRLEDTLAFALMHPRTMWARKLGREVVYGERNIVLERSGRSDAA